MILQNPMTSLDPLFTIGNQLGEVLATRCDVPAPQLRGAGARASALGAHHRAGGAAAAVPARALRRHAAAGADRDGRLDGP
jgi:ABC-type dipeptide/oligopeptide/nickel transport system ATPase component